MTWISIPTAAVLISMTTAGASSTGEPRPNSWSFSPDGRTVRVSTEALSAVFRDGAIVSLEDRSAGVEKLFLDALESAAFPALRHAAPASGAGAQALAACRREGAGARISVSGLSGDPSARSDLEVSVADGGDLLVRQSAEHPRPGLLAASWAISGIDASRVRIILPANGGISVDGQRGPGTLSFPWPGSWQTALAIVQGEGGGFSVWTEDPEATFKNLEVRRQGRALTLALGAESREPAGEARRVLSPVWRIRVHRGDWKVPAAAFREAMARARAIEPIGRRRPAWIGDIRLVARVSNDVTVDHLRSLAREVDPRQTILYIPGWRKLPYDVLYPDYEPREGFVAWCRAAQEMGFRVMPHGNLVGIGPKSPDLPRVERFLQTDRTSGSRVGWYLDRPDHPGQIYCMDPAAAEARRLLAERFRRAWEEVRFDALHLDYPVIVSTRHGDIEGKTCARGAEVYLRELQAALPEVALGTEGLNEVLLGCSFAQVVEPFTVRLPPGMEIHPVRSFLFAPFCGLYGHLGMPSQATSFPAFLEHHDFFDRMGSWPTLSLDGPLDPASAGTRFVLDEARFFQAQRLVPAPGEARLPEELFAWKDAAGKIAAVLDDAPGRRLAPRGGSPPAWALLGRVNVYEGPGFVAGWQAFDEKRLFGLNPERRYPLVPGAPDPRCLHLDRSSRPVIVEEVRDGARRSFFRLAGSRAVVADLVREAGSASAGIEVRGRRGPIASGAQFQVDEGICGGRSLPSIFAHPPWQGDDLGGETWGELSVEVPAAGRTVLRFSTGIGDLRDPGEAARDQEKPLSDGAVFRIEAESHGGAAGPREIYRELRTRGAWVPAEADLGAYAGKRILLRLVTGPGPSGDCSWDWALWGQPQVIYLEGPESPEPLRVRLFSPRGEGSPFFEDRERPGRIVRTEKGPEGATIEVELPRPQAFGLLHEVQPAAAGTDLSKLPFTCGSGAAELLVEGRVYGSGSVGRGEIDGKAAAAINGHPPDFGRTVLDWCLELPAEPLRLDLAARVLPLGGPVAFEVQVDGRPVWSLPMPFPAGWKKGSVDLAPWAGRKVLLSLVTDSLGTNICDWAQWGDLRLTAR